MISGCGDSEELFLSMDHPRVARLLDVYESEGRLSLVMECMEGWTLARSDRWECAIAIAGFVLCSGTFPLRWFTLL